MTETNMPTIHPYNRVQQDKKPPSKPDWAFWSKFVSLPLWKLILLSLDQGPDEWDFDEPGNEDYFRSLSKLIDERFQVAVNHIEENKSRPNYPSYDIRSLRMHTKIRIDDFLHIAKTVSWELPAGFPKGAHIGAENVIPEYCPPYLRFMLKAARGLELSPDDRRTKNEIESWLIANWPKEFGDAMKANSQASHKVQNMATFLRRPEQEKGGQSKQPQKR
jgi:hypothetical protein|tara:strand:- start:5592 stop:6248 length:657 start_codon:yes stop_codon:yes gene_type:complete